MTTAQMHQRTRLAEMKAAIMAGRDYMEIARNFGVTRNRVNQIAVDMEISRKGLSPVMTKDDLQAYAIGGCAGESME